MEKNLCRLIFSPKKEMEVKLNNNKNEIKSYTARRKRRER